MLPPSVQTLKGLVLPQETQTGIEQHLPPTRTISHRQRIEHADTGSQRFALHTSSMVAPSSNAQGMNYHQNLLQQQQFGGRNFSSTTHQHTRPQLLALAPHQGAVPGQQFRQPFQHGQQMGGYLMDPTRPTIAYGHPQGFDQPYSQVFPQLQPQQSIPGSQMAYYPAAQYYPRQFYHNTPSTITRPERNYITPLHPSGPAFTHGPPAIASAGPGLLQTNSAGEPLISYHSALSFTH